MNKKFDYVVFIGRFQPLHIAHLRVMEQALQLSGKLIVAIGSSHQPRTPKNPWTFDERSQMIRGALSSDTEALCGRIDPSRIHTVPIRDFAYNDQQWTLGVQEAVQQAISRDGWTDKPPTVALIGHNKDETSYYLKLFPQWGEPIDHDADEVLNATDLRELYFEQKNIKYLQALTPASVFSFLESWRSTSDYVQMVEEYDHLKNYKKAWAAAPYAPTFVTADAVVVQSGHVLLVKRRSSPGKGLWAIPGGFVNQNERLEDAAIRELREETRLKVPDPVLRGSIKNHRMFDAPSRSLRGRTITAAYLFELAPGELPKVKGSDDAEKAVWVPINEIKSDIMFEDHFDIITYFLGQV